MSWKPAPPPDESMREPRMAKLISIEISSSRQPRMRIIVRNMSAHGIGCRGECDILPCERVVVHLANDRDVAATVRWVRKGVFGLALDERIDPAVLAANPATGNSITPRDTEPGFHRLKHTASYARAGFQRSHREDAPDHSSSWQARRIDD